MIVDDIRRVAGAIERGVAAGPIVPDVTPRDIRAHLESRYDFGAPLALEEVVADVERMMRRWQVQVTHPRYFGLFNPSVTEASVVADTLVAAYNPQLATLAHVAGGQRNRTAHAARGWPASSACRPTRARASRAAARRRTSRR